MEMVGVMGTDIRVSHDQAWIDGCNGRPMNSEIILVHFLYLKKHIQLSTPLQ